MNKSRQNNQHCCAFNYQWAKPHSQFSKGPCQGTLTLLHNWVDESSQTTTNVDLDIVAMFQVDRRLPDETDTLRRSYGL